jgi:hypothetical protein
MLKNYDAWLNLNLNFLCQIDFGFMIMKVGRLEL